MIQRLRVPLGFVIAAGVLYLASPTATGFLIGLPIAIAGALLRGAAAGTIRKDASLATTGPYTWTRNPLYLGSTVMTVGFAVMSSSLAAAALLLIPSALVYPTVIRNEERHLARLFPREFREYCSRAPRFFPRFRHAKFSFSFQQYLANREYNTALGFGAAMAIFIAKWLR
jgi:protein-S-isoprenylcysteine O-methyltransferase Ste14